MSFWLDDDDVDPWTASSENQRNTSKKTESHPNSSIYASQSEVQFCCDNCGGPDSYTDTASGMEVCSNCFTQSQAMSQPAETDWDDVIGLAARTAGGRIKHQQYGKAAQKRKLGDTGRTKQPLSELDRSVRLPDTAMCLRGMRHILQEAVRIVVNDLIPQEPVASRAVVSTCDEGQRRTLCMDDDDMRLIQKERLRHVVGETVRDLWLSYLRAWSDGAEYYGAKHPDVRFSFRDLFLDNSQASQLLRLHLPHIVISNLQIKAETKEREESVETIADDTHTMAKTNRTNRSTSSDSDADRDTDEDSIVGPDEVEAITNRKVGTRGRNEYPNGIRMEAIRKVVQSYTSGRRKGYKEAALHIRPSMAMAASLIWLAITKHREVDSFPMSGTVTSYDFSRWITNGKLPLMTAFRLLSPELQTKLEPVAPFFRMDKALDALELEAMAMNLCVACRLRLDPEPITDADDRDDYDDDKTVGSAKKPKVEESATVAKTSRQDNVRFWSISSLPTILAQLIGRLGLDQGVLDRTLLLTGFSLGNPSQQKGASRDSTGNEKIPTVVRKEQLTRIDELLALIAIACQLDPNWREWTYCTSALSPSELPRSESQFRLLSNGPSFRTFLDYIDHHVYPDNDDSAGNANHMISMLPQAYLDADRSIASQVRQKDRRISNEFEGSVENDKSGRIRPCFVVAGGHVSAPVEVTNMTYRRLKSIGTGKLAQRKSPQKPRKKKLYKNVDALYSIPMHDFRQTDRAASNWIPHTCPDADQDRLVQFLAYAVNIDPVTVRRTMLRILRHQKL